MVKKSSKKKLWVRAVIVLMPLLLIGIVLYIFTPIKFAADHLKPNYAEDVAKPIEQSLIEGGATKTSSRGDGHGPDNQEPWYNASYQTNLTKTQAVELINNAAQKNGYKLTHASPGNRGFLSAADKFIANWYFDETSKEADHNGLKEGNIMLVLAVNHDDEEGKITDPNKATIILQVKLPSYK